MSSEIHNYIETALDKQDALFNAEVINFPKEKTRIPLSILKIFFTIFFSKDTRVQLYLANF